MEPTITTFQPSSIVLQCGADSLGCDRLGCFNLSIAAHGECVRFIKSFNLPLLVLGGGGYTIKNVSRCWAYETAVLLDLHHTLPSSLPHTAYDDFFAPDWKLHPDLSAGRTRIENLNTRKGLEKIRVGILERLRFMHGAPSVGMTEIPPGLAPWLLLEEEGEEGDEEDGEGGERRMEDGHRKGNEWFEGDKDREGDERISGYGNGGSINTSGTGTPSGLTGNWAASTSGRGEKEKEKDSNLNSNNISRNLKAPGGTPASIPTSSLNAPPSTLTPSNAGRKKKRSNTTGGVTIPRSSTTGATNASTVSTAEKVSAGKVRSNTVTSISANQEALPSILSSKQENIGGVRKEDRMDIDWVGNK